MGYAHNRSGHEFRIFEDTGENVFSLTADAVGSQWLTFRARYEVAGKTGSGLDEALLVQIGEQPALRHYDIANRGRQRFTGQVDIARFERWIFSAIGRRRTGRLRRQLLRPAGVHVPHVLVLCRLPELGGFGAGGSYTYEQYGGFHTSRSANPGDTATRSES